MARRADPSTRFRCETCSAEIGTPGQCPACLGDPNRLVFIEICVSLLRDVDAALVEKARELRVAGRWPDSVLRRLLAEARRRHLEGQRQRDAMLNRNGNHRAPRPKELARTAR